MASDASPADPALCYQMIPVIIRYDDFSARSDTALEVRLMELFSRYGISCVVGVVPLVCDGDERSPQPQGYVPLPAVKSELLRSAVASGAFEVALHGCHHQNLANAPGGRLAEFAGRPYADQRAALRIGAEELKKVLGQDQRLFIPPFNAYDPQTVRALVDEGFCCLSAGMFEQEQGDSPLCFAPHTCGLGQLKGTIEKLRETGESGALVMPLFHSFDFVESDPQRGRMTWNDFENLVAWAACQPDVQVTSLSGVPLCGQRLSQGRLAAMARFLAVGLHPLVPAFIRRKHITTALLPEQVARGSRTLLLLTTLCCYGALLLAGTAAATLIAPASALLRWLPAVAAVMVVILSLYRSGCLYFRAAALVTLLAGVSLGTWLG